jgi:hypothetical protein
MFLKRALFHFSPLPLGSGRVRVTGIAVAVTHAVFAQKPEFKYGM